MNPKEIPVLLRILRFLQDEHAEVVFRAFKSKEEKEALSDFWQLTVDDYDVYISEDFAASREAVRTANPKLKLLFVYLKEDKQGTYNNSVKLK